MTRVLVRGMVAMLLIAVTASLAMAQPGGGRPGGGRGGFGGGRGPAGLLMMPEVQKELGLSETDVTKLTEKLREGRPERGAGNREEFQNLSDEERQKRREEFRKQAEEMAKKSDEIIKSSLTEAQFKRLGELRLQREGVNAFERSDIAEKLKLTAEQKEKITKLTEEGRPQFGRRGPGAGAGGAEGERPNFEEMRARREKLSTEVVAVLTPEQKTSWDNMQGARFEFPQRGPGGEVGGRRRGNRPPTE